jgi:hypothetical protein
MNNVTAYAVRNGTTIEVTVGGFLPNSCHTARVEDFYPGGSRQYLVDPDAAQVFIEETIKPGSNRCLMMLIPWGATVPIPDKTHTKVEIFVNNHEVLEVSVVEADSQFIVIALTGTDTGCSIVPNDALYPAIYSKVYGPDSYDDCKTWIGSNCKI